MELKDFLELSKDGGPWGLLAFGGLVVRHLVAENRKRSEELERMRQELRQAKRAHLRDLRNIRRRRESEQPPS